MSLLDQLSKQAAQRKAGEDTEQAQVLDRQASYAILETKLTEFKNYLEQLTKLLAQHPEKVQQHYEIPGYGTIVASIAHDYVVKLNQPNKTSIEVLVSLNATIQTELCPNVEVQGVSRIQTIKALFDKHRIPALTDPRKDASGAISQAHFRARGKIPMSILAQSDAASGMLKLTLSNFEDLGQSIKTYTAEQVNEQLFDQIGHYLARKDNELTKEKLPDGVLKKLRHTAQQNEMRRKWEEKLAAQALAEEEAAREAQEQKKLSNRMIAGGKSLLDKLSGLIKKKPGES